MLTVKGRQRGKYMRKGVSVLILSIVTLGLAGCSQAKTPDISSVSIEKDGTVSHQIVGQFEQNYYEMDGLSALAAQRVEEYCAGHGDGSVELQSVESEDGKILIDLKYASPEDYSSFNNRELYVGTLEDAASQGYVLEKVAFVSAKGEPMELGYIDDPESKKIMIAASKPGEEMIVNTYGKALYINQSAGSGMEVSFAGKKSVRIAYPAAEDGTVSAETLSYVIFE